MLPACPRLVPVQVSLLSSVSNCVLMFLCAFVCFPFFKSGSDEFKSKMNELEVLYGRHALIRRQMEVNILSKIQRLPTLDSEFVGLDTILGADENILPRDFMDRKSLASRHFHTTDCRMNCTQSCTRGTLHVHGHPIPELTHALVLVCVSAVPMNKPQRQVNLHAAMELQIDGHFI